MNCNNFFTVLLGQKNLRVCVHVGRCVGVCVRECVGRCLPLGYKTTKLNSNRIYHILLFLRIFNSYYISYQTLLEELPSDYDTDTDVKDMLSDEDLVSEETVTSDPLSRAQDKEQHYTIYIRKDGQSLLEEKLSKGQYSQQHPSQMEAKVGLLFYQFL